VNVLVTAIGSSGDVNPLVAISIALKKKSHSVVMLVNPYFKQQVEDAGLEYRPLGEPIDLRQIAEMPELMDSRKALTRTFHHLILPNVPVTMDAVEAVTRNWEPDIVLGGHSSYGARWVCERHGIPYAGAVLSPLLWLSRTDPSVFMSWEPQRPPRWYVRCRYHAVKWILRAVTDRPFNRIRTARGFPKERFLCLADILRCDVNLGLWSPHFRGPCPDDPPNGRICGFPWFDRHKDLEHPSSEIDRFVEDGEPPVIFTLGTAAVHIPGDFFQHAIEACRIIGRRGVLLTRYKDNAPKNLPSHVRAFTYAPFSTLLPRGCASVHHGGVGTTAQAMRAGKPTVIVPYSHDQFDNAARAARLGVSATLARKKLSPVHLADALRTVLEDPRVVEKAEKLGQVLSQEDGALNAALALEEIVVAKNAG
jgi:UDP:flavonoid glycosyltransferase YjiC (YdhE family)